MRTKTLNQIAQEAAKYAVETLIESKLYEYLENLPSYSSLYTNRLDAELAEDQRIIKKTNENL